MTFVVEMALSISLIATGIDRVIGPNHLSVEKLENDLREKTEDINFLVYVSS